MGIDYASAKKLIRLAASLPDGLPVLMLGRHRMQVKDKLKGALDRQLEETGFKLAFSDLTQEDGYSERFFNALGFGMVSSMDLSDYEGAEILHDLNDPVPPELRGRFGLIFDGGTTEHVFDVATCMNNLNELLQPGGVLVSCVPANGWFAHGFYQFGPELVYGYWKHGCGFDVLSCSMLPEMPRDKELTIDDPAAKGLRPRVRGKVPNQRVYLYYEVRKGDRAHPYKRVLQTDYVNKWSSHDEEMGRGDTPITTLRKQQLGAAKGALT